MKTTKLRVYQFLIKSMINCRKPCLFFADVWTTDAQILHKLRHLTTKRNKIICHQKDSSVDLGLKWT